MRRVLLLSGFVLLLFVLLAPLTAEAQVVSGTNGAPAKLHVFLDFLEWQGDPDFYQQELPFVDHVRTRQDSDVHVQVTHRSTGSGGSELTLTFFGHGRFEGERFSVVHVTEIDDSDDEVRRALAQKITLALARFIADTPLASSLSIRFTESEATQARPPDPWNGWVFHTYVYGYFSGESQTDYTNVNGSGSVSKVTGDWKYTLSLSSSYDERTYRYDSVDENGVPVVLRFTSIGRGHSAYTRVVNSLGPKAAAALVGSVSRSTFSNEDLEYNGSGGLEWSVWPYSQSTTRLLVLRWWLGARDIRYEEETIFLKKHEQLVYETVHVGLKLTQPWGSVSTYVNGSHYMHDFTKRQANLYANLDVRLFKGLSLNVYGQVSLVRDQLYLPAGGATPEEILLQRKQLATDYQYWTSVGITYTFGSIYSTVVNPRFD